MVTILTVLGAMLGVIVPGLFAFAMNQGVARSPFDNAQKSKCRRTINVVTFIWTVAVWVASLTSVTNFHAGDHWPRIAISLFLPVLAALVLLLHPTVNTVVKNIPVAILVGVQAFRLAGFVFLIIPGLGLLPHAFVIGGYGDIATGVLAIVAGVMLAKKSSSATFWFVLFSVVGLSDLINVAGLLFYYFPIWNGTVPSSAALTDFSLVMVPALAAPMALILHLYAIRNFCLQSAPPL